MERSKVLCSRRMFPVRFGGASDTLIVKRTRSEESDEKDRCWHMVCAPRLLGPGARSKIPASPTTGYRLFSQPGRSEPWNGRIVRPSAQHWKCCIPSPVSRVQIPLVPRSFLKLYDKFQGASRWEAPWNLLQFRSWLRPVRFVGKVVAWATGIASP